MTLHRLLRIFLLTYNWDVRIDAGRQELIDFFNAKFNSNSGAVGHTTWKTIHFMCPTIGGSLYNYSLIGFQGIIDEKQPETVIHLKARFGQPFLFFYIIPALLFPTLYIFDIDGMRENLNFLNNHFLNVIVPPTLIWSVVMIYYKLKIGHAITFISESLAELQTKKHYNTNL
jgi:hypothetical protein